MNSLIDMQKQGKRLGKIVLGGALLAIGVQFFQVPNNLVVGGVSGLAIIASHLIGISTGLLFFALNLLLFLVALPDLGFKFMLVSLLGVLISSVLIEAFSLLHFAATYDLILVSVFSGLFVGAGVGIILSADSSAGGTDAVARVIQKRLPGMTLGKVILCIDSSIIIAGALLFRQLDLTLYALISAYILKRVIDAILE